MSCRVKRVIILLCAACVVSGRIAGANSDCALLNEPDEWFRSSEGSRIADNILSWQSAEGSWPKNIDTANDAFSAETQTIKGTFDNGATTGEMRFLAQAFNATKDQKYKQAFIRGLDHILKAQYPTGGWPQFYPPDKKYHRHITFNDNTMVNLMKLLLEITQSPQYDFVDHAGKKTAKESFERGIDCILKCQIKVNGRLTAWCAQHDEIDYSPQPGRAYELVSISGAESSEILSLLMSIDNPSDEIIHAVTEAADWYDSVKIEGIRIIEQNGQKVAVKDSEAPPLWARFYEIETNRPIFADRDGVKKYDFNEISSGRREGYSWYGHWGTKVASNLKKWKEKLKDADAPQKTSGISSQPLRSR